MTDSNKNFTTIHKYETEFNADSVEWCPHEPFKNYFVCANYELLNNKETGDKSSKRLGRVLLFSISNDDSLKLHQSIETEGILDQKWCHHKINGATLLAVATSNKKIIIFEFNEELVWLNVLTELEFKTDENVLVLSLDWSTGKYCSEPEIVCSDSTGNICRVKLSNEKLEVKGSWNAHSYEAWISAFYYWDTNIVFTGGDDSLLKKFDQRVSYTPVAINKQAEAGVTSIHSNFNREYVLITGSYDNYIRLWDIRTMKSCVNDIKMPGPVWRLKWDPFDATEVLAACMLEGVHIVNTKGDLNLVANYKEHKDISYGIDWSYMSPCDLQKLKLTGDKIVASCSFYDRLLCVSNYCNH